MKRTTDIPLVRYLALTGQGSRRMCDNLILEGRVRVNDTIARPGMRVIPDIDTVLLDNEIVQYPPVFIYLLLYKPKGYLVSDSDPENRPLAKSLLPDFGMRLFPVGRLDFQTEGAILYTNDGLFANQIAHPRNRIQKTYMAKVRNIPTSKTLHRWTAGIKDQKQILKALDVRIEKTTKQNAWLRVVLTGGYNHQVRRMGQATGHPVVKLVRLSIGKIDLTGLKPGQYRELNRSEIKSFGYSEKAVQKERKQSSEPARFTKKIPMTFRSKTKGKKDDSKTQNRRRK
ncbi:MAG: pseudouridine synthase [bacterium]